MSLCQIDEKETLTAWVAVDAGLDVYRVECCLHRYSTLLSMEAAARQGLSVRSNSVSAVVGDCGCDRMLCRVHDAERNVRISRIRSRMATDGCPSENGQSRDIRNCVSWVETYVMHSFQGDENVHVKYRRQVSGVRFILLCNV